MFRKLKQQLPGEPFAAGIIDARLRYRAAARRWRNTVLYYLGLCKYTFAQRRNRLTTHFSERIPVVKRSISVFCTEARLAQFST